MTTITNNDGVTDDTAANGHNNNKDDDDLPSFALPKEVTAFMNKNVDVDVLYTDHDYFEAIWAVETARCMKDKLEKGICSLIFGPAGDSMRGGVFSSTAFGAPDGPESLRGADLSMIMKDLVDKLDSKRQQFLDTMKRRPVVEKFLDEMDATDIERKVFRHVLVATTGLSTENVGRYRPPRRLSRGEDVYSAPIAEVHSVFRNDDVSLGDLMAMVSGQSKWVQEEIYAESKTPSDHMSAMNDSTARALMGLELTVVQLREIGSTMLQSVIKNDEEFQRTETGKGLKKRQNDVGDRKEEQADLKVSSLSEALVQQAGNNKATAGSISKKERLFDVLSMATRMDKMKRDGPTTNNNAASLMRELVPPSTDATDAASSGDDKGNDGVTKPEDDGSEQKNDIDAQIMNELGPYNSDLDYLEDQVLLMDKEARLAQLVVRATKAEAGDGNTVGGDDGARAYRRILYGEEQETQASLQKQKTKLQRELKMLREKIGTKLVATRRDTELEPRLEQLCEALALEKFEKYCVLSLVKLIIMPSPVRDSRECGGIGVTVGSLIERFCSTLEEKTKSRRFFYKSSTLMREGILMLRQTDFMKDLSHCGVELDRRLFDYIVGLDTEMSELVDGSHLYQPNVNLDDVVLPAEMKKRICDAVLNFDNVKDLIHTLEVDQHITYGLGQAILFYGASGTGKTMMANAIATKMQRKVLLVNFNTFGANISGAIIKFLFREAKLNRALLFFDECESLFRARDKGGQSVQMILTELERYDGLCLLATNRAFDLDEAMHRRISLAVEFRKPDHILREQIWQSLRPPKLPLAEDIDYQVLAQNYELTGGLIKNSWLTSIGLMVRRGGDEVKQEDLMQAASEQVVGQLSSEEFDRRVVPTSGIEAMVLDSSVKESLNAIVQSTKARSVLHAQWGFHKLHRMTQGLSALFTGAPGTGKSMAAEAIGYDLGRPILAVNVAELVSKWVGETAKNVVGIFADAKNKDAVLVFDEAEGLFASRSDGNSSTSRHDNMNVGVLLQYIESFSGICIVITNRRQDIDDAFLRRFRFVLEFEQPNADAREEIWRSLIPDDCPLAADVCLKSLASRYEMCGGDIKNALLCAATRAALRPDPAKRTVAMSDLTNACQEEMQKRGGAMGSRAMYS